MVIVPDSQENDWQNLGFSSHVEFIRSSEEWDEIVEHFRRAVDSYRRIGPVVIEATESMTRMADSLDAEDELIRETQAMAIDIRHTEYPKWDGYGTYWYDPSGFHSDDPHVCFICSRPTSRIDIDFHAAFCNSEECNDDVRRDLERLNGGPEIRD